jgi:hypothetical protein
MPVNHGTASAVSQEADRSHEMNKEELIGARKLMCLQ